MSHLWSVELPAADVTDRRPEVRAEAPDSAAHLFAHLIQRLARVFNKLVDLAEDQVLYRLAAEIADLALAAGGQVTMPFAKTFWAEGFGMLVDRYGTPWMVNVETASK